MKKTAVILLLLVYTVSSTGATIHFHYCMNRLAGWSLLHDKEDKCSKCGMKEKDGGCCKEEHRHFQVKEKHIKANVPSLEFQGKTGCVIPGTATVAVNTLPATRKSSPVSHAPPGAERRLLFILNAVFRV